MRIRAITCEVLARTVYQQAALAPHVIDVELLGQALHDDRPASRLSRLQSQIDATPAEKYQAIVLVYGLCNLALEGLEARDLLVAVARAHDCITLYLGSRERYNADFSAAPGTFYYSDDYLERQARVGTDGRRLTMGVPTSMDQDYDYLVTKFGEDNARYLVDVLGQWHSSYVCAVYVETGLGKSGRFREQAASDARQYGWRFEELKGAPELVRKLLAAEWGDDFLVLRPGQRIAITHDSRIVEAV